MFVKQVNMSLKKKKGVNMTQIHVTHLTLFMFGGYINNSFQFV